MRYRPEDPDWEGRDRFLLSNGHYAIALYAALNDHDRMKRSTDIPLFFARREKDTVLPRILIDRIEDAAEIATWDAARKIRELKLCLRENAIIWWKSLRDYTINLNDWDIQHIIRWIVSSEAYQRASTSTPEQLSFDPQNRLLARGPRFRLSAEMVRDAALKSSGLLVHRVGGPSVNPYMPVDLWREVSHYGSTPATAQVFVQDHGEKLYRRSMYTYWKRTAPPPNMMAFDTPNREVCTVARAGTTTPLQSLVTLNDVQFVECARNLAQDVLKHSTNDTERVRRAFRLCLARDPRPEEVKIVLPMITKEITRYRTNPQSAALVLSNGESLHDQTLDSVEHAAWTQIASMILNLSEAIMRN